MAKTIPVFSDIDFRFEKNPLTGDVARKIDNEAVKTSMKNLILTSFFERPFDSSKGSSVRNALFEPITPLLGAVIKKSVEQVIINFEPRVDLQLVKVTMLDDENAVDIEIHYTILGTQALQVFNMILERTR